MGDGPGATPRRRHGGGRAPRPRLWASAAALAETLADEHSALLVPPDNANALCAAIVRLIDDACLRLRLAHAARQAAETHHTWRQNAERALECLEAR